MTARGISHDSRAFRFVAPLERWTIGGVEDEAGIEGYAHGQLRAPRGPRRPDVGQGSKMLKCSVVGKRNWNILH